MAKKPFTATADEDIVPPSDAASEPEAFAEDQPKADGERHAEDATGATNEDGRAVAVPDPAPEQPKEEAGELPGKGGQFVSLGNGRVRRI